MEHDSPTLLFRLACEHLISARVIRPGVVKVIERVATAREAASRETFDRVVHLAERNQPKWADASAETPCHFCRNRQLWAGRSKERLPESLAEEAASPGFEAGQFA
jgi:hypothetical protein